MPPRQGGNGPTRATRGATGGMPGLSADRHLSVPELDEEETGVLPDLVPDPHGDARLAGADDDGNLVREVARGGARGVGSRDLERPPLPHALREAPVRVGRGD